VLGEVEVGGREGGREGGKEGGKEGGRESFPGQGRDVLSNTWHLSSLYRL
jgi:hypothetical protein